MITPLEKSNEYFNHKSTNKLQIVNIFCVYHNVLWQRLVCEALNLIYMWKTSFLIIFHSSKAILLR